MFWAIRFFVIHYQLWWFVFVWKNIPKHHLIIQFEPNDNLLFFTFRSSLRKSTFRTWIWCVFDACNAHRLRSNNISWKYTKFRHEFYEGYKQIYFKLRKRKKKYRFDTSTVAGCGHWFQTGPKCIRSHKNRRPEYTENEQRWMRNT